MAGQYEVAQLRLPEIPAEHVREKYPQIRLASDHKAELVNVPEFDEFGENFACRLSGSAKWQLVDRTSSLGGWAVEFSSYQPVEKAIRKECQLEGSAWAMQLLSRNAPYRLYDIVGDPDSDTGIEYERASTRR